MRSHPVATVPSGDFVTPDEFNAELGEIVATSHSLDHDNVPANTITTEKIELGAFGGQLVDGILDVNYTIHSDDIQIGDVYAIPNSVDEPWVNEVTVGDCVLECCLSVALEDSGLIDPVYLWVGLRIDGVIIAKSPTSTGPDEGWSPAVFCAVPVSAGTHLVEAVFGMHPGGAPFARTITWQDRIMEIIEVAR